MDLGTQATLDWIDCHWRSYLRSKWMEHLRGIAYWIELRDEDYGQLQARFKDSPYFEEVIRQFLAGGENLTIINWAYANGHPIEPIHEILRAIDINSCRLKCDMERGFRPHKFVD